MKNGRAKATAVATVLGLGGLAGVAIESNHGLPPGTAGATSSGIVTQASGAPANSGPSAAAGHAPIVTRASGAVAGSSIPVDD